MQGLPISPADTISLTLETSIINNMEITKYHQTIAGQFLYFLSPVPFFLMRSCNFQFLRKIFQSVREFLAGIQEVLNFYLVDCNLSVFRCQYCAPTVAMQWQCMAKRMAKCGKVCLKSCNCIQLLLSILTQLYIKLLSSPGPKPPRRDHN